MYNKICDNYFMLTITKFLKSKHKTFRDRSFKCAGIVVCTTILLHCPINAEVRAAVNQSDYRICQSYVQH